ncbi:hypothetical protein, partial [Streptomyces rhizosphaericus]|uniref:hypothetical protein n=1 Tax=Streptomyces rhizosphaericus TaxID=114699 RepID=UPI003B8A64FB
VLGQPRHPALRGQRLRPAPQGRRTRRHRGRPAVLTPAAPPRPLVRRFSATRASPYPARACSRRMERCTAVATSEV